MPLWCFQREPHRFMRTLSKRLALRFDSAAADRQPTAAVINVVHKGQATLDVANRIADIGRTDKLNTTSVWVAAVTLL